MIDRRHGSQLRELIRSNLAAFEPAPLADGALVAAAVAILIVADHRGAACFPLEVRSPRLRSHAGQLALPGGRLDPGEGPVEAAIRELEEELGIAAGEGDVLGVLDRYPTRSGYAITPVVLWGGDALALRPAEAEIARLFLVPLGELERPGAPRFEVGGKGRRMVHFQLPEATLHAPTAAVLYQFREVALNGRPTRVADLDQPRFTWR